MTLHTLMGKRVRAGDAACVGHVYDFRAECEGREIAITHIRVGPAAWIERLRPCGALRHLFRLFRGREFPWEAIARVEREVQLKPEWDRVRCRACAFHDPDRD